MNVIRIIVLLIFPFISFSHEVRPAYLSVIQENDSIYQVTWKVPALGDAVPKIYPKLPSNWVVIDEKANLLPGNLRRTYKILLKEDIAGSKLSFEGQELTLIDILVSIKMLDGTHYSYMVKPVNPNYIIPTEADWLSQVKTYFILGVDHILTGIDHLLFVLALLLITSGFKKLVKTITAFTIAHSITLSLAALGVVGLPSAPVEAVIALSIVFLALELINYQRGKKGLTYKYPWVVAFSFGLLHGFGFAGALADIGLPQNDIPTALLFFNVGVEAGQLIFVLFSIVIIWLIRKPLKSSPRWVKSVPAYVIGSVASFWLIERCINFVN